MAEIAAVGWTISILGWLASPITARLFNHGFSLFGFDKSDKLRDLESRILPQLALLLEHAERIPPEQKQLTTDMEQWACRLRSAFYDVEDILDVADYNRLENKVN
ncbi:hypothetical protein OsJ_13545 [Oryza sativa Japonica Group]|jgi:hypothetical protein|uniref:Rx N-terminal domain-containing protein n=1 Tax=Oryza sativa subsp. japonica TaxID=39947 RepID=A3AQ82_ORYSJ|nr:hypothetical protein OsJ_13545 [Oryza sativa Japonica Group]